MLRQVYAYTGYHAASPTHYFLMVKQCHRIKPIGRKDQGEMWCDERVLRVALCTECLNPGVVCLVSLERAHTLLIDFISSA